MKIISHKNMEKLLHSGECIPCLIVKNDVTTGMHLAPYEYTFSNGCAVIIPGGYLSGLKVGDVVMYQDVPGVGTRITPTIPPLGEEMDKLQSARLEYLPALYPNAAALPNEIAKWAAEQPDTNIGTFQREIQDIFTAYRTGKPVVVFSTEQGILVGIEEVQTMAGLPEKEKVETTCIFGIDQAAWEATDCPELCEAARQAYYLKQQQRQYGTITMAELDKLFSLDSDPNPRKSN